MHRKPAIERALELAEGGNFRIPSEVRKALIREGYTRSEIYGLEGKATWRQLREKCAEHWRQTVDTESAFEADFTSNTTTSCWKRRFGACISGRAWKRWVHGFQYVSCWPWSQ